MAEDREGWSQMDPSLGCIELREPPVLPERRARIFVSRGGFPEHDALLIDTSSTGGRFDCSVQVPVHVLAELFECFGYRLEPTTDGG